MPRRSKNSPVFVAVDYRACQVCRAYPGDPCRTDGGRTRTPHKGRLKKEAR